MDKQIKKLREKAKKETDKKTYLRKWVNKKMNSNIFVINFKIDLNTKNKILKICDKKGIFVSEYLRNIIKKNLKGGLKK